MPRPRAFPLAPAAVFGLTLACGSSPTAPSQPPTPTFTLSGIVSESAPTTETRLGGVIVTIASGTHSGSTATTDASGNFQFTDLSGPVTISAARAGYVDTTLQVYMDRARTVALPMLPLPTRIDQRWTGVIAPDGPRCLGGNPCLAFPFDVRHRGPLEARLSWTDPDAGLWLVLYEDAHSNDHQLMIASGQLITEQQLRPEIAGGHHYLLVVWWKKGSDAEPFTLTVSHPN